MNPESILKKGNNFNAQNAVRKIDRMLLENISDFGGLEIGSLGIEVESAETDEPVKSLGSIENKG